MICHFPSIHKARELHNHFSVYPEMGKPEQLLPLISGCVHLFINLCWRKIESGFPAVPEYTQ